MRVIVIDPIISVINRTKTPLSKVRRFLLPTHSSYRVHNTHRTNHVVVVDPSPLLDRLSSISLSFACPNATFLSICPSDITWVSAGHINHSLFWKNLAPSATERRGPGGVLKE